MGLLQKEEYFLGEYKEDRKIIFEVDKRVFIGVLVSKEERSATLKTPMLPSDSTLPAPRLRKTLRQRKIRI